MNAAKQEQAGPASGEQGQAGVAQQLDPFTGEQGQAGVAQQLDPFTGEQGQAGVAQQLDPFTGLVRGRIVYYQPREDEARRLHDDGPWPAQVTKVHENGVVDLLVTLPTHDWDGKEQWRKTSLPYSAEKMRGYWHWMYSGQGTRGQSA